MKRPFAEQYGELERWHWWFRGRQRILEAVLRRKLNKHACWRIASVGSGPVQGLGWLVPLAGPHGCVVGLDAEPLYAVPAHDHLWYVVGRLEAAPFTSGSFDVVLALDVLEHLDDDAAGLCEAARLVKPDGLLVVTVPALPSLWGGQDVVSEHRRRYTRTSLRQTFTRAGLPPPYITYFNVLLFPPIAAIRWGRRLLGLSDRSRSDFEGSRPGWINETFAMLFACERHLVGRVPMPLGVSLLATLRMASSPACAQAVQ